MSDLWSNILLLLFGMFFFLLSQLFQIAAVNENWDIAHNTSSKIYAITVFLAGLGGAIWFIVGNWR